MPDFLKYLLLATLMLPAASSYADTKSPFPIIENFGWMDRNHLAQQIEKIDELGRTQLGTPVRGDSSDIALLQRIIHRSLIPRDDTLRLQALGAVLGNVMVEAVEQLEWKVYKDELGRSRAVCVRNTQECLFPVTMLSRRIEVGLVPDVQKVYDDALKLIQIHLPQNPYDINTPLRH